MTIESSQPLTPESASEPPPGEATYREAYGSATQYWKDPIEEHKEWLSTHGLPESDVNELLTKHNRIEMEVEEDVWFLDRLKAFLLEHYGNSQQELLDGKISVHMMQHFKMTILEERDILNDSADKAGSIYSMKVSRLLTETGSIRDDWYSFLRTKSPNSTRYILRDIIPRLVEKIHELETERNIAAGVEAIPEDRSSLRV